MKNGVDYIGVGCGALIIDGEKTLLVKRTSKSRNRAGFWSQPGGGVEVGEKIEDAVKREIKEELGIEVELVKFLSFTESIMKDEGQHWVSFSYLGKIISGEVKNLEPEKHEEVEWIMLDELPEKLTQSTQESVREYLKLKK